MKRQMSKLHVLCLVLYPHQWRTAASLLANALDLFERCMIVKLPVLMCVYIRCLFDLDFMFLIPSISKFNTAYRNSKCVFLPILSDYELSSLYCGTKFWVKPWKQTTHFSLTQSICHTIQLFLPSKFLAPLHSLSALCLGNPRSVATNEPWTLSFADDEDDDVDMKTGHSPSPIQIFYSSPSFHFLPWEIPIILDLWAVDPIRSVG